MNMELIEKLEEECEAKASRIKKLEHKLDLVMQTESKAETAIGDAQLAHFQSQP